MSLWKYEIERVVQELAGRQYRFLTVSTPHPYVAIVVELYRSRQEDLKLEVPFDELYERVVESLETQPPARIIEPVHLRRYLDQLQGWGNLQIRVEPRRIRRIQDRGLERYLVRLLPQTHLILGQLESRMDQTGVGLPAPAAFSLGDVNDALQFVVGLFESHAPIDPDEYVRAGRALGRIRYLLEEAGDDLLRLDLWLSELAMQSPEAGRIAKLLEELEAYFERYLSSVDHWRQTCSDGVRALQSPDALAFLAAIRAANERELSDDPTRRTHHLPDYRMLVTSMAEFLYPDGVLDQRRRIVHQRLAEVAGRLKRFLNDLLRRSQVISQLRTASRTVMHAKDSPQLDAAIDESMHGLWESGHTLFDGTDGTPDDAIPLARPHRAPTAARPDFAGATVSTKQSGTKPKLKASMLTRLEVLNQFVNDSILKDADSANVANAQLADISDVRQLIAAIRESRLQNSKIRQRSLTYGISKPDVPSLVTIPTADGTGRLTLPELTFHRVA